VKPGPPLSLWLSLPDSPPPAGPEMPCCASCGSRRECCSWGEEGQEGSCCSRRGMLRRQATLPFTASPTGIPNLARNWSPIREGRRRHASSFPSGFAAGTGVPGAVCRGLTGACGRGVPEQERGDLGPDAVGGVQDEGRKGGEGSPRREEGLQLAPQVGHEVEGRKPVQVAAHHQRARPRRPAVRLGAEEGLHVPTTGAHGTPACTATHITAISHGIPTLPQKGSQ